MIDRAELVRLAGDPAVTSDSQLAALAGCTVPDLRELLAAEPELRVAVLRADAERARSLTEQALAAEKLAPAQLLAVASSRYADRPRGQQSLFDELLTPRGEQQLEALLEARDPALVELLDRYGFRA